MVYRSILLLALVCVPSGSLLAQDNRPGGKGKDEWMQILKEDKSAVKRRGAVVALTLIGIPSNKDISRALAEALQNDSSEIVRQKIVEVLAGLKNEELREWIPKLADVLKYDKNAQVRAASASVLKNLGELAKPVQSNLVAAFKDEDANTRAAAVEAVGRIGREAKSALPDFLPLLKDKEVTVRMATVFALGRMGDEAVITIPDLGLLLANDSEVDVRKEVLKTYGTFGPTGRQAIPSILKALEEDKSAEVRQQAVLSLGKMGSEIQTIVPKLQEVLKTDKDKTVRLYLVRTLPTALGENAKSLTVDFAQRLDFEKKETFEPEGEVRLAIIEELGAIGPPASDALPYLRKAQQDVQVVIRDAARAAIKKIGAKLKK